MCLEYCSGDNNYTKMTKSLENSKKILTYIIQVKNN